MAYTKRNKLLFIKAVCERYNELKATGLSVEYIHRKYLHPEFKISKATLYTYLSTNYKLELKKLDDHNSGIKINDTQTNQLKLF